MKCPKCGRDNSETQIYCTSCGASLYGSKPAINVNNTVDSKKANDIASITGIDINDLQIGDSYVTPKKKSKATTKNIFGGTIYLILFFIIVFLGIYCTYLYMDNKKLAGNTESCPEQKECPLKSNITGIYGISGSYLFYIPRDYRYIEKDNDTIISGDDISLVILGSANGQVDRVTTETIKSSYNEDGYTNVSVNEDVLSQRKIIYVTFVFNNISYTDYYYQYDSEKYLYGQISSSVKSNLLTNEIKDILASITIEEKKDLQVVKAPITYDKLFALTK